MSTTLSFSYTDSLTHHQRLITHPVKVGNLTLGNGEPIKIQSMTTTDTMDTQGTVEQIKRLIDAGCEIVRITTPSSKSSENLENIKNELLKTQNDIPIVADVHFNPNAALKAAEIVEKVRINPGNFVDRKKFEVIQYTDIEYKAEIKRIEDKLIPLLEVCKKNNTTLRIGTNHGSLSDRIVNRYGDNPQGMVASAIEFLDICEKEEFDQLVFSMKSSNTMVMVAAYRLLVRTLKERKENDANKKIYPIHLGVTEAGDGEDGRIKSATGIGTLLSDGIGDTIRVSLTEDPEKEIPVAQKIVSYFDNLSYRGSVSSTEIYNPYEFKRFKSKPLSNLGGGSVPKVMVRKQTLNPDEIEDIGYKIIKATDKWEASDIATDLVHLEKPSNLSQELSFVGVKTVYTYSENSSLKFSDQTKTYPLISLPELLKFQTQPTNNFLEKIKNLDHYYLTTRLSEINEIDKLFHSHSESTDNSIIPLNKAVFIIQTESCHPAMEAREFIIKLRQNQIEQPILFEFDQSKLPSENESRQITLSLLVAPLLIDGLIDGLYLNQTTHKDLSFLFSILQASRQRISRTEYISCPSCGRTLFNLQEVTAKVKEKTNHLKGVKIAVMGCIVNGPGEMADADFGYVGSGPGKITLYKGKEIRVKNIPSENAVDSLVDLIKSEGSWQEKSS